MLRLAKRMYKDADKKQNKSRRKAVLYYNYHAKVKKLILEGKLTGYEFLDKYNGISPVLLLYFSDHKPMPIRDYMWEEYLPYIINFDKNKK